MSRKLKYVLVVFTWVFLSGFSFYLGISLLRGNAVETASANAEKPAIAKASFLDGILGLFKSEENQAKNLGGSESKPESPSATEQVVSPVTQEPPATDSGKEHTGEFRASTWFSDYEAMKRTVKFYNEIHPFIYGMKGGLTNTGALVSSWGKESKIARVAELKSLNPNVKIIPTIFRWENPKEKISENIGLNGRSDIRDFHIKNILFEVDTYGYDGIDIDYEGMSCNKKEKFEEFIVLLSKEMKKRNKILSIAVHPKTGSSKPKMVSCKGLGRKVKVDFQENWRGPTTHDYEFLAK
ncbi:MAG: hydrolase, partial [Leptospira sp.]|nr:hydrolase [Leptospira sp.]